MAIPSREKTFGLENCRDLLRKLEWELEGLRETPADEIENLIFRAFNGAVTAWQIGDWVWKDMTKDQREALQAEWGETLNKKGEFLFALRKRDQALKICREIATASKHVEIKQSPDPTIETSVSADVSGVDVNNGSDFMVTDGKLKMPGTTWELKVSDRDQTSPFLDVLDNAAQFWSDFIGPRGIAS